MIEHEEKSDADKKTTSSENMDEEMTTNKWLKWNGQLKKNSNK